MTPSRIGLVDHMESTLDAAIVPDVNEAAVAPRSCLSRGIVGVILEAPSRIGGKTENALIVGRDVSIVPSVLVGTGAREMFVTSLSCVTSVVRASESQNGTVIGVIIAGGRKYVIIPPGRLLRVEGVINRGLSIPGVDDVIGPDVTAPVVAVSRVDDVITSGVPSPWVGVVTGLGVGVPWEGVVTPGSCLGVASDWDEIVGSVVTPRRGCDDVIGLTLGSLAGDTDNVVGAADDAMVTAGRETRVPEVGAPFNCSCVKYSLRAPETIADSTEVSLLESG